VKGIFHSFIVLIHVCTTKVDKWCLILFLKQEFSTPTNKIKGSCYTSISSKSDKSLRIFVCCFSNAFKINNSYFLLKHLVQKWHIIILCFDGMRKEEICFVCNQVFHWHFLYSKNDISIRYILLDYCTNIFKLVFCIASSC